MDDTPATGAPLAQGSSTIWTVLRLVLVLGLSVAAIYGIMYWLRKLSRPQDSQDPSLRVVATTPLGSNRYVHIISVGTQAWLIGSSEGGVEPIAEITNQETLDMLFLEESRKGAEKSTKPKDFSALIRRFVPGLASTTEKDQVSQILPTDLTAENLKKKRERLRGL
ncbi:MAG: flagellar biosynthetic protein FliO [Termitinemataceae bacterium]